MKDSSIYRPKAIEAYNSRTEFQRAIRIITPKSWIYLVIIFLFFIAGFIWLIFGNIATLVNGKGIILAKENDLEIVSFFNIDDGKKITVGMSATVYPLQINTLEFGGMKATVTYVSEFPVTAQMLQDELNNQVLVDSFLKEGPVFEVRLTLIHATDTYTGYRWTTSSGPEEKITAGSIVNVGIAASNDRPINIIMNVVKPQGSR
jgi:hypothetical protein